MTRARTDPSKPESTSQRWSIWLVRYGLGIGTIIAAFVLLIINPGGFGLDAMFACLGAGGSILLLNALLRLGRSGDTEREQEEDARTYLREHGHWPDEERRSQEVRGTNHPASG